MRLTGYASRGLRLNYSSMKLEFLAHKWTVTEKFLWATSVIFILTRTSLVICLLLNLGLLNSAVKLNSSF